MKPTQSSRALGLRTDGVEPSPAGREAARNLYGIDLRKNTPVDCRFTFDLITFVHSLEHSRDPVGTLKGGSPLLRSGGGLFIEVPHAESVERWSRRRGREIRDLPAHLYHFVPRTLRQVVERAGFRVTRVCLSNPSFVESALAVRARMRRRPGEETPARDEVSPDAPVGVRRAASGRGNWWTEGLLPWIRRTLPGWKFRLLATKPS